MISIMRASTLRKPVSILEGLPASRAWSSCEYTLCTGSQFRSNFSFLCRMMSSLRASSLILSAALIFSSCLRRISAFRSASCCAASSALSSSESSFSVESSDTAMGGTGLLLGAGATAFDLMQRSSSSWRRWRSAFARMWSAVRAVSRVSPLL